MEFEKCKFIIYCVGFILRDVIGRQIRLSCRRDRDFLAREMGVRIRCFGTFEKRGAKSRP